MATKKQKSFDAELDHLLEGLELPSNDEMREETRIEKISKTTTGRQRSAATRAKMSFSKKASKAARASKSRFSDI